MTAVLVAMRESGYSILMTKIIGIVALLLAAAGCSATAPEGSVTRVQDARHARVSLGAGRVRVGDRVAIYERVCPEMTGAVPQQERKACLKHIGGGTIRQIFNEQESRLEADASVPLRPGAVVVRTR